MFSRFRADCVRPGQLEAWGALALGGSWRLPGLAGPVTLGGSGSGGFPLGPGFLGAWPSGGLFPDQLRGVGLDILTRLGTGRAGVGGIFGRGVGRVARDC